MAAIIIAPLKESPLSETEGNLIITIIGVSINFHLINKLSYSLMRIRKSIIFSLSEKIRVKDIYVLTSLFPMPLQGAISIYLLASLFSKTNVE
jgi:hypothetical protein